MRGLPESGFHGGPIFLSLRVRSDFLNTESTTLEPKGQRTATSSRKSLFLSELSRGSTGIQGNALCYP